MRFEKVCSSILEESKVDLIFESVYANEIFQDLIDFVAFKVEHFPFYVVLDYEKLVSLIKVKWKLKKHLDRSKIVFICLSDEIEKTKKMLALSDDDIASISSRAKQKDGIFVSSLADKSKSLIVVNENLEYSDFKKTLFHEIIHFLQWNTGRTIHEILGEDGLDVSDQDVEEMSLVFHEDPTKLKDTIENFFDAEEREAYFQSIFTRCAEVLKLEHKNQRKIFKWFLQMLKNKSYVSFRSYFDHVIDCSKDFGLTEIDFRSREMRLLLIYGFYEIGFTSLVNHLLGYFKSSTYGT